MVENEHDTPDATHAAGTPTAPAHDAPTEGIHDPREGDHELFADPSDQHAPETVAAAETPEPIDAAPPRKRGGYWQKFTLLLALLGLTATGLGFAAIKFKDKDERLRAISDAIDAASKDPEGFAATLESKLTDLWDRTTKSIEGGGKPATRATAAKETAPAPIPTRPAIEPAPIPPKPAAEPAPLAAMETPRPTPTPGWAVPQEPKPAPIAKDDHPAPIAPPLATRNEDSAQIGSIVKRVEQLETTAREALETAKDAQRTAKGSQTGEKPAATNEDEKANVAALEGRIDELADEIRKLREQLEQPKGETRVAPDAAETAAAPGTKSTAAAETLALTQSLLHALERGRPFAVEQTALSERGVDPQLLAALAPLAEHGAPTAARLLASFAPVAKRLRALDDAPLAGGSIADQLLHDAGKLVRVRPVTQSSTSSIPELVARIETALGQNDFDGASEAFSKLPDNARVVAKAYGDELEQRREAEQAAASLLANALASLGHPKK
ncbi:MAG: hypothetical protein WB816_12465 [Methylocystis sp.]